MVRPAPPNSSAASAGSLHRAAGRSEQVGGARPQMPIGLVCSDHVGAQVGLVHRAGYTSA